MEIPILEERTSIREGWNTSSSCTRRRKERISAKMPVLSRSSEEKLRRPRELFPLLTKSELRLNLCSRERTSLRHSPEPNSKNSTWIFSREHLSQSKKSWKMLTLARRKLRLSWSEDLPEFPRSNNLSRSSSMERSQARESILMKLLPTELLSRLVFFLGNKTPEILSFLTLTLLL